MSVFNLAHDPWIPVRWKNGQPERPLVSLREAFAEGSEIADLSCAPHERVSLIRLLVCVTQAALGAPANPNAWAGWGMDLATAVPDYLAKWEDRFELFGDGPRFLQVKLEKTTQAPQYEFLEFRLKSNDTLFDHHAGTTRNYPSHRVALGLLTLQNHFLPGSTGSPTNGGVKGAGPAINYLHSFLIGSDLASTIRLNCLDQETISLHWPASSTLEIDRPTWELAPIRGLSTTEAAKRTHSYLGRLVPVSCAIWLRCDVKSMWLSQGLQYPEFAECNVREPSATVVVYRTRDGKSESTRLLKADPDRAIWRDLHNVAMVQQSFQRTDGQGGPLILQSHLTDQLVASGQVDLWCGELIRSKDSKGIPTAKLEDVVEELFPAPSELFTVEGQQRYAQGVEFALHVEQRLETMIKDYQNQIRPKPTKSNKDIRKDYPSIPSARRHFWTSLDRQSLVLLDIVKNIFSETNPMGRWNFGERHDDRTFDPWTKAVFRAAEDAYDHVCPRQTPRQLQAYAAGIQALRRNASDPARKKSAAKA